MRNLPRSKQIAAAGALVLAGLGAGAALGATTLASAADDTSSSSAADDSSRTRGDETPLTGATATKVEEAALAKYPGATVERVETDSDGVYEAHLVTADGERVTVLVDKAFKVTGTETGSGPGDES